jgi:hypothetical protein
MKISRSFLAVLCGLLTGLFLAGCFNPVSIIPGEPGAAIADSEAAAEVETTAADLSSFTIQVRVGNSAARSVAGPDSSHISATTDILNFIQVIATDEDGKLAGFDEAFRKNASDSFAELWINDVDFGHTYNFLVLVGHWDRDYAAEEQDGQYKYKSDTLPTLLAAGFKSQEINPSDEKVQIDMYAIVVDTKFIDSSNSATVEPEVADGSVSVSSLASGNWDVKWTIQRKKGGNFESGLIDLIQAQEAVNGTESLAVKSFKILRGESTLRDNVNLDETNMNVITQSLSAYTVGFKQIGYSDSVTFNLTCLPFNLTGTEVNPWTQYDSVSKFTLTGSGTPEWIIRNGVNNKAQDGNTIFSSTENWNSTANGNGAVAFEVVAKDPDGLVLSNGSFYQSNNDPVIDFTVSGVPQSKTGEIWYARTTSSGSATFPDDYVKLGDFQNGVYTGEEVSGSGTKISVYLFEGGRLSNELVGDMKGGTSIGLTWPQSN